MELYLGRCWLFPSFLNVFFRSVLNWAIPFSFAELIESFSVQHLPVEAALCPNPQMSIRKIAFHGTLQVLLNHQAVFIILYLFEFVFEVLYAVHWKVCSGVFGHFLSRSITLFWKSSCVVLNDDVFPSWRHDCLPWLGKCLGVKTLVYLRRNKACSWLLLGDDKYLSPAAGLVNASAETHFIFALPTIQLFSCAPSWNCCH